MNKSETINELATALSKAQRMITGAKKDSANPFFKSKYADLESCLDAAREPMAANGLSFTQLVQIGHGYGDYPVLETMLMHTSGQYVTSRSPIICAKPNDPQAFGAALTYFRRFNFSSIIGLSAVDDDGNVAAGKTSGENEKPALKFVDDVKKNESNTSGDNEINRTLSTISEGGQGVPRSKDSFSGFVSAEASNAAGDFVITFGKHKGKKVRDFKKQELVDYANWLENAARDAGKPLQPSGVEFIKNVDAYLA